MNLHKADIEISNYLHTRLKEEFSEIGFISEEENNTFSPEKDYFILDPIDGTTNFTLMLVQIDETDTVTKINLGSTVPSASSETDSGTGCGSGRDGSDTGASAGGGGSGGSELSENAYPR